MKEEILVALTASIMNGILGEDDFFTSNVFYYLAGRFPNATIGECAEVISSIRSEYLDFSDFLKGELENE